MLRVVRLCGFRRDHGWWETDKLGFSSCYALNWDEEKEEEDGQDCETFRCAGLGKGQPSLPACAWEGRSYNYFVIPSKNGKLIKPSDQVPARGDIAR